MAATKLFVGSLSYGTNKETLEKLFSAFGKSTSVELIVDRYSNQSKGFAFVELESKEEAEKAIKELNGNEVDGRKIIVNIARPKEDRSHSPNRPSYRGSRQRNNRF